MGLGDRTEDRHQQKGQQRQGAASIQQDRVDAVPIRQRGDAQSDGDARIQGKAAGAAGPEREGGQPVEGQRQKDQGQKLNIICLQDGIYGVLPIGEHQPHHQADGGDQQ